MTATYDSLCQLDVNLRTERRSLVASAALNLSRKPLKEKVYFIAKKVYFIVYFTALKIKCGKSKGIQERVYFMGVWSG